MVKKLVFLLFLGFIFTGVIATGAKAATIDLDDYAFNIDGIVSDIIFDGDLVPAEANINNFDEFTGLGTIDVTITDAGSHFVGLFVDHRIDKFVNGFANETGSISGTHAVGDAVQTWEIDEPGFVDGDIFVNFQDSADLVTGSALDNGIGTSIYGDTTFPDDVSMAMGWDFTLDIGQKAIINFLLSTETPTSGFYLLHNDLESNNSTIYFSSTLDIRPIPEPSTLILLGLGMAGLVATRKCCGRRFFTRT